MGCRERGSFPFSRSSPGEIHLLGPRQGPQSMAVETRNRKRRKAHRKKQLVHPQQANRFPMRHAPNPRPRSTPKTISREPKKPTLTQTQPPSQSKRPISPNSPISSNHFGATASPRTAQSPLVAPSFAQNHNPPTNPLTSLPVSSATSTITLDFREWVLCYFVRCWAD